VIGLVGLQGVGKSSALLAVFIAKILLEGEAWRKQHNSKPGPGHEYETILFKWRRQNELFRSLLDGTHEASLDFHREYAARLLGQLEPRLPLLDLKEVKDHPDRLNIDWAEGTLGRAASKRLRQLAWLEMLRRKKIILIDTPDYSKTDRRLIAKDLEEIYWVWNHLSRSRSFKQDTKPNLVIAIQKEMFRGHFFFDKMEKIELEPLEPKQMLKAYLKRFKTAEPFTEDALLTLARMSRGIFRRFQRYIMLTLDLWETEPEPRKPINASAVNESITRERLAEDMELELSELFPKQSDLQLQAVRVLLRLSESGSVEQSQIAEELGIEPYAMSRLLSKLELHKYITRSRVGTNKIVSLRG